MKALLLLIPALFTGCGFFHEGIQAHQAAKHRAALTYPPERAPDLVLAEVQQNIDQFLKVDMPVSELREHLGQDPDEINVTTTPAGRSEQWVYPFLSLYVYAENGRVVGWQLSRPPNGDSP